MQLLAAANPNDEGALSFPPDLHEERFNTIGSGLYGELRDDSGQLTWRSRSALGLEIPQGGFPRLGARTFERESLEDGTPLLTLSLAVQWEFPDGELKPYVFKVAESLDSFNAQVAEFRRQLIGWFAAIALIMLLSISILMRGLLRPLRQIETEIGEIEEGKRASLSEKFPTELTGVARNMNLLIDNERARSDRYRKTLDNLAHSLKTPLAAMRALIGDKESSPEKQGRFNEQIERMDEIVRYQLRKPAASAADNLVLGPVPVAEEVARLVDGLRKVYHDKHLTIESDVAPSMKFRGDTGDFLELAGNLLDNACKWCKSRVSVSVRPSGTSVGPDAGLPARDSTKRRRDTASASQSSAILRNPMVVRSRSDDRRSAVRALPWIYRPQRTDANPAAQPLQPPDRSPLSALAAAPIFSTSSIGNTIVLLFSLAISLSVCRYRSVRADSS
jgi:two-component system sensor histidine kinase PhoQ